MIRDERTRLLLAHTARAWTWLVHPPSRQVDARMACVVLHGFPRELHHYTWSWTHRPFLPILELSFHRKKAKMLAAARLLNRNYVGVACDIARKQQFSTILKNVSTHIKRYRVLFCLRSLLIVRRLTRDASLLAVLSVLCDKF